MAASSKRRRFFVPEVVQTSAMDCGPASLHCLLQGFGLPSSYARLQEACQVDLDGTSINTIESIAVSLGLDAEQVMMPADHVTLPAANALPALIVVQRDGMLHFMIAWRRIGSFIQVMDPASGRRWLHVRDFEADLHLHAQRVPAAGWREWAGSAESTDALRARLDALGVPRSTRETLVGRALADEGWRGLAALDATVRLAGDLVQGGRVRGGVEVTDLIVGFLKNDHDEWDQPSLVPAPYWSVSPDHSPDHVMLHGAVLLRVRGALPIAAAEPESAGEMGPAVPSSFAAALAAPPDRPLADIWQLVRKHGVASPALLTGAVMLAGAGAVFELLLLRGMLEWNQILSLREQRLVAVALVVSLMGALLLLDLAISDGILRIGRRVETRLRALLLEKLPRLSDRYFRSRLISDMALRAHSLEDIRALPDLAARFVRVAIQLVVTAAGLTWLDVRSGAIAWVAVALALVVPLAMQKLLAERDLRLQIHAAALSRYYLDSLVGLIAARTHGAERALRRRHEARLVDWGRAGLQSLRSGVFVEGLQLLGGLTLAAWIVLDFIGRGGSPGAVLLVVYWALSLPTLGREIANQLRVVPAFRNVVRRVAEILNAPEEPARPLNTEEQTAGGVTIELLEVGVRAGGKVVLDDVNLHIASGEHVAVVGRSGAGKSTLAGLLLGWSEVSQGGVIVDGNILDASTAVALRARTAWVDPAVQIWNRSLLEDIRYSQPGMSIWDLGPVVAQADLVDVLDRLPGGFQATLGEGGGLTSGGEGQRVRFARALLRKDARLVILDEPFRGLDRTRRRALLERAREIWRGATVICITHDIEDTLGFERVVVLHEGTVVEDGDPKTLSLAPGSTYRGLLQAEREVRTGLASGVEWRRWRMEHGAIVEDAETAVPAVHVAPVAPVAPAMPAAVAAPVVSLIAPIAAVEDDEVQELVESATAVLKAPVPIRPVEVPRRTTGPVVVTAALSDASDAFEPEEMELPTPEVAHTESPWPTLVDQPAVASTAVTTETSSLETSESRERTRGYARRFAAAAVVLLAVGVSFWLRREVAVPELMAPAREVGRATPVVSNATTYEPVAVEVRSAAEEPAAVVSAPAPTPVSASVPRSEATTERAVRASAPAAQGPAMTVTASAVRPSQPPAPLPLVLATMPRVAMSAPSLRVPDMATRAELVGASTAAHIPAGRGRMSDDVAIRQVLFQYERSYDRLDAASAAAVWRGVDVRGLTRAFASLTSQNLSFDTCDVRIEESHATAQCRGGLMFVRRIGDPEPEERRVSWTFGFDNDEGRWVISSVKAR